MVFISKYFDNIIQSMLSELNNLVEVHNEKIDPYRFILNHFHIHDIGTR